MLADKLQCLASVRGAEQVFPPGENLARAVYKAYFLTDMDFIPVHAIRSAVYGPVVIIIVQDGKVVRIDRTEKVRLR